jgi:RNA polymerase sigma-70 factor (ECF subfamily)
MDDLTLLRSLRDDVAEPDAARLAPAYLNLETAMRSAERKAAARRSPRAPRRHPIRWAAVGLTAAAAVATAVVVGGVLAPPHPASASAAAIVLRKAASEALADPDPVAGPGQYLKFEQRYLVGEDETTAKTEQDRIRMTDLYVPANLDDEWVQVFHGGGLGTTVRRGAAGAYASVDGPSHADQLRAILAIPTGSGAETLASFDAQYQGGSTSREEDDWKRITDVLEAYPLPALLRARLFEALALIPGATSTPGVANLDGRVGIAIGRSEPNRGDSRREIIVDPDTGQLIGTREMPRGESGPQQVSTISTTVVDAVTW